jgi:Transposase IS116/IS110/IS902 family
MWRTLAMRQITAHGNSLHYLYVKLLARLIHPTALDPGKSVNKKARMSKAGNRHIHSALYMPALSAKQHAPPCQGIFRSSYGKWQETVAGRLCCHA